MVGTISIVGTAGTPTPVAGANGYSRTVTIDNTKVPSDQTNFTVVVAGTYSYLATVANGGKSQDAQGDDVRFYSNSNCSTGLLNFQRVSWSATTGAVQYHILLSAVSSSVGTVFYMCYGNPAYTSDVSVTAAAYDANTKGVWHMGEASGNTIDTIGTNDLTPTTVTYGSTGKLGLAYTFGGSGSYTQKAGATGLPSGAAARTLCSWLFSATTGQTTGIFGYGAAAGDSAFVQYIVPSNLEYFAGFSNDWAGTVTVIDGAWHQFCVTFDGDLISLYVDGALDNSVAGRSNLNTTVAGLTIGGSPWGEGFTGLVDEPKLWDSTKTADFITALYNNENSPATFYTIGSETAL